MSSHGKSNFKLGLSKHAHSRSFKILNDFLTVESIFKFQVPVFTSSNWFQLVHYVIVHWLTWLELQSRLLAEQVLSCLYMKPVKDLGLVHVTKSVQVNKFQVSGALNSLQIIKQNVVFGKL